VQHEHEASFQYPNGQVEPCKLTHRNSELLMAINVTKMSPEMHRAALCRCMQMTSSMRSSHYADGQCLL
jgi:hypothetical protein